MTRINNKESSPVDCCDCIDCHDREYPCFFDCDRDEECDGCKDSRIEKEEQEFEAKQALGGY